jgi:hypothetical protein
MEIDLKAKVTYVIIRVGKGYVILNPEREDTNIRADKKELLSYFDVMEGDGRIIEKFKGCENDEKLTNTCC